MAMSPHYPTFLRVNNPFFAINSYIQALKIFRLAFDTLAWYLDKLISRFTDKRWYKSGLKGMESIPRISP